MFCPFAAIFSYFIQKRARQSTIMYTYTLERRNIQYLIFTNNSRAISNSITAIDLINIVWCLVGSVLNVVYKDGSSIAIINCENEYGFMSVIFAFMFTAVGYFQILRFTIF